jgi:hypothetical protein
MDNPQLRRFMLYTVCMAFAVSHFGAGFTGRSRGLGLIDGNAYLVVPAAAAHGALAHSAARHQ